MDPLADLDDGGHGADVLMDPDAAGPDYDNDDLRLCRCYRDGHVLREIETDAFVRRLRDDDGDPLGEIPADASSSDESFSPLLATDVPPGFVTLEAPDGENVVTRVLALDVELDKLAILAKLGSAVGEDGPGVDRIEAVVTQLADFQGVPGVEAMVEQRLL